MEIVWTENAWKDFQHWKKSDAKKVDRIKKLLENIQETPHNGLGKPEALKFNLSGWWSRRIDSQNRLVYRVTDNKIEILACRYHYYK
ncbi:Txe/YoeB family addiction module toxin [Enterococcus innesii]|nr:Txe/YoeB family addiction module toxin [Enterococcus innesii]